MNLKVFHENKLSTKYKIVIWLVTAIIVYTQIDTFIHLFLEFLHTSFEFIELVLDNLVEHIFHTDLHTTQVITFYLMLLIAVLATYKVGNLIPGWYYSVKTNLLDIYHHEVEKISSFWQTMPATSKMKWWAVLAVCSGLLVLWLLS